MDLIASNRPGHRVDRRTGDSRGRLDHGQTQQGSEIKKWVVRHLRCHLGLTRRPARASTGVETVAIGRPHHQ